MTCEPVSAMTIAMGIVIAVILLFLVALATYSLWSPAEGEGP